jgi:two-component system KDP operon response regulator KdpE
MNSIPQKTGPARILVVEDERDIAALVAYHLTREGYRVRTADGGAEALQAVSRERPDLVILDLMLPGFSGYDVLAELRRRDTTAYVPVIVLTARRDEEDRVKGLELGADDYVTKPFNHLELLARVKAVLRRLDMPAPADRVPSFRSGELEMDFARQELRMGGKRVELTPTEYKLLYHFIRNAGYVLTHGTLLAKVWGREYVDEVDYLRVYVRRLRDKLGDDSEEPRYIRTERGLGYRFLAASGVEASDEAR